MAEEVGGSAANERLNTNYVKSLTFDFTITAATPTPSAFTVVAPTVGGEAALIMADGAGVIVPLATFDVTVTGSVPKVGLEFKDTAITGAAELIGVHGVVSGTSGAGNTDLGCPIWAGPADLLLATGGVGMALYFHIGQTGIGLSLFDQATGVIKIHLVVHYLDR